MQRQAVMPSTVLVLRSDEHYIPYFPHPGNWLRVSPAGRCNPQIQRSELRATCLYTGMSNVNNPTAQKAHPVRNPSA